MLLWLTFSNCDACLTVTKIGLDGHSFSIVCILMTGACHVMVPPKRGRRRAVFTVSIANPFVSRTSGRRIQSSPPRSWSRAGRGLPEGLCLKVTLLAISAECSSRRWP